MNFIKYLIGHLLKVILFLLRPFIKIRFGLIIYRSYGRISGNIEYYLRCKAYNKKNNKEIHILVSGTNPVNKQIIKMLKRHSFVIENDFLWTLLRKMQGTFPKQAGRQGDLDDHPMWINLRHAGFLVEWKIWKEIKPQLSFTDSEHIKGQQLLTKIGLPNNAKYVCIMARDKAFVDSPDYVRKLDDPFSFNDYRDCDINTFLSAAEWLTKQGIWVVRMGIQVVGPMDTNNNKMIIDYASYYRRHLTDPDFADLYIHGNCFFYLGCPAGPYYFSHIFNVPIAMINGAPLAECGRNDHDLFIIKKYFNRKKHCFMTFKQMVERGAHWNRLWHDKQKEFEDEGIIYIDNTPEEILDITKEMYYRLNGTWTTKEEDIMYQNNFKKIFPEDSLMRDFPGYMGYKFAKKYASA